VLTGATPVIAVSRTQWKLDMAERMGAHHVIKAPVENAVDEVKRPPPEGCRRGHRRRGERESLRAAVDMLRPGGRFSAFAVSHEAVRGFSTFPLYFGEISIIGSRGAHTAGHEPEHPADRSGAVDVNGFISAKYRCPTRPRPSRSTSAIRAAFCGW